MTDLDFPSAAQVRAWIHHRTSRRGPVRWTDRASDVYNLVLTILVWVALMIGLLQTTGADSSQVLAGAATHRPLVLMSPPWLALTSATAALVLLWAVLARLGPMGLPRHRRLWLLALPLDRRGVVAPSLWAHVAIAAGVGALAGLVAGAVAPSVMPIALAIPSWAACAVAGLGVLVLLQIRVGQGQRIIGATDLLVAATVLLALLLVVVQPPAPPSWLAVPVAVTAAVLAVVAVVAARRALGSIREAALARGGDAAVESGGALAALDTRALGRALDRSHGGVNRVGALVSRLARVVLPRVPRRLAPMLTLAVADLQILVRAPRRLLYLVVTFAIVIVALSIPGSLWVIVLGVSAALYAAAVTVLEGARQAQLAPALDDLLPMGQRAVRVSRLLVPSAVLGPWCVAAVTLIGALVGGVVEAPALLSWAALGVCLAPAAGAAALRGAYRPLPRMDKPPIVTPMGIVPQGLLQTFAVGPDALLVVLLPLWLAVLIGAVTPMLVIAQIVLSLVVVVVIVVQEPKREE